MSIGSESVYVARQAIVDAKIQIIGYELLFRNSSENSFPEVSSDLATTNLIVDNQLGNNIEKLVGDKKAFINFTESSLLERFPDVFDSDKIVVEILETVSSNPEVVNVCKEYRKKGYTLALDDHDFDERWKPFNDLVDIIKIDISCFTPEELQRRVSAGSFGNKILLAERVETHEEFNFCRELGFKYFQGFFFARPEIIKSRKLAANKISMLRLLAEANAHDLNFDNIEKVIAQDASLTFKLLKFINSPGFGKNTEINSVKHAVTYLGEKEMRKFISLVAMANASEGKPPALMLLAAVRANFCEKLAIMAGQEQLASSAYLCGLLSLIDAVMDDDLKNILSTVPVDLNIKAALEHQEGVLASLIKLVQEFERGDWIAVDVLSKPFGFDSAILQASYGESLEWAQSLENLL